TSTPLPAGRRYAPAVWTNGFIALPGGEVAAGSVATTAIAPVTGGVVGTFITSTGMFTGPRIRHGTALHDGVVYVIGGTVGATVAVNDVWLGPVSATDVGPFTQGPSLPDVRTRHTVATTDTSLY